MDHKTPTITIKYVVLGHPNGYTEVLRIPNKGESIVIDELSDWEYVVDKVIHYSSQDPRKVGAIVRLIKYWDGDGDNESTGDIVNE